MQVQSIAKLEALYDAPAEATIRKEITAVNGEYRRLIEASPFFAVASAGPDGLDCSPRGDGPGCVHILNDTTLAFADRRGNNRLDTLRNIIADPRIALLLMIPGWNECLRINGSAMITTDDELRQRFVHGDKLPATVVVISIETMYFQCARAIKRAGLWDVSRHVDPRTLPTAGELVKSAISEFDANTYDANLPERQAKTLY